MDYIVCFLFIACACLLISNSSKRSSIKVLESKFQAECSKLKILQSESRSHQAALSAVQHERDQLLNRLKWIGDQERRLRQKELDISHLKEQTEQELLSRRAVYEEHIQNMVSDQVRQHPYIASQISDLHYLVDMQLSDALLNKPHPALKASEDVARIAKEKRTLTRDLKALQYQLSFYESLFPELSSLADYSTIELYEASQSLADTTCDRATDWLSDDEYKSLPDSQKFQLALDRWRRRTRSNWQVGRDFERYIGYRYEIKGYKVSYYGALNGKSDLCRDLIAQKDDQTLIIQCKRWSKNKTIHEKHVFQLFGSVISYSIENPTVSPKGLLITTCPLSDTAQKYAHALNVDYVENYSGGIDSYPLIKCNLSKSGEKIFHLPFDQQYDRIQININRGEFYASSVQEALDTGFRRAYRWHGNDE